MTKKLTTITERTDQEWPSDHPLRALTTPGLADRAEALICTLAGEERTPPPAGDHDVNGVCAGCGKGVVHRASAPESLIKMCWPCWEKS